VCCVCVCMSGDGLGRSHRWSATAAGKKGCDQGLKYKVVVCCVCVCFMMNEIRVLKRR
jgi:hypothetical protein